MRKLIIVGVVVVVAGAATYFGVLRREEPAAAAGQAQAGHRLDGARSAHSPSHVRQDIMGASL